MALSPDLQKFTTASQTIASYSFNDLVTNRGILTLYGAVLDSSAGTIYSLDQANTYSKSIETPYSILVAHTTATQYGDLDFDLGAFANSQIIGGTGKLIMAMALTTVGNMEYKTAYIVAKLRKWDGTTETEIASGQSANLTVENRTTKRVDTITFTIPNTHFKAGETVRLTIEVWGKCDSAGQGFAGTLTWAHDGNENRDGTNIIPSTDNPRTTTKLIFDLPFVVDF